MDCLEFRRRLGAEPQSRDPAMLAHRESCPTCAAAWEKAQRFEQPLHDALDVPLPGGLIERTLLAQATGERQRAVRRRRIALGLAASLLIVLGGGGIAWRQSQARALPTLAVAHMPGEIGALALTRPLAPAPVAAAFAERHAALRGPLPQDTTYVHVCDVGPFQAVHLVSRPDGQPVVVLYVPARQSAARRDFRRDGWFGREVPLEHGTLVMLANRQDRSSFDTVEQGWRVAIDGLGERRVTRL
jgi:hypothetical protein